MKKILFILGAILFAGQVFAQGGGGGGGGGFGNGGRTRAQAPVLPPAPLREVSGVVRDSSDNPIIGATITLTSAKDTVRTSTNVDGIFVLKNVKLAVFTLSINSIGYIPKVNKYKQNDVLKKLVLDPIILKENSTQLKTVTINGVPSITYKVDTVEYKASDYKVRENSTVDELLKKMEGFEVGSDGSVTHQGQQITKAKLNGKTYASGDVATAIQNLPADIVEKIQVVDDYGDQAARTGIKDGDPQKVLNITTRADRSVGETGRAIARYGNDDRYYANLFVQRINANQQLGLIGNLSNTVNGVASSGIAGGATNGGGGGTGVGAGARGSSSPGTTKSGGPNINYRDQWGKKVQVIMGYGFNFSDNYAINSSYGSNYTSLGQSNFVSNGTSENDSRNHNVTFEMDIDADSSNYVQINPSFSYSNSTNSSNSFNNTVDLFGQQNGTTPSSYTNFQHPVTTGLNSNISSSPNYGMIVLYQHIFKKPKRNISFQGSINKSTSNANGETNKNYLYYADTTENTVINDSLVHEFTYRTSINTTLRGSMTYSEPIGQFSRFEFNGQTRRSSYDNTATVDSILANGTTKHLDYLSNIYNYSFTETRLTFNYRFEGTKWNWSLGTTLVPTVLAGTKLDNGAGADVSTSRSDFKIIPVFRFAYSWSRTERFTLTYSGTNNEPNFTQIQPFIDKTNQNNIIVGNPNLVQSFNNSITAQYNNYIANSKLNFSLNGNGSFTDNQISSNVIQIQRPIGGGKTKTVDTTFYVNLNGAHAYVLRYNIAKQLDDRRYNLSLNGNITYGYSVAMSGTRDFTTNALTDILYHNTNWRFDERFGPRIDPVEDFEINPYIGYDLSRSFTSLPGAVGSASVLQTTSLAVDGYWYILKLSKFTYSATKSYVTGLTGLSTNPLVINAGFEQEFLKKKNLVITFNIFDLLHQNNFIQQTVTPTGVTNTLSNSLSRYFLFGVRLNLQKWSGTPTRNGKQMQRRGDGSFIYN
ncbi:outer membrane beta-barrel protein [uncultured Mucilaginibacter sp.]|uniref:outer membrane beta-barrel protein n=1 Tax=uncultured Mucilaginibacter sp. TaxID=797541 RepID=UPI0025E3479D|nr:outer membrane beta-barrel protein [uncultured Mucilaginibacter sp.]